MKYLLLFFCLLSGYSVSAQSPFITTWKTDNPGGTADNQIRIPIVSGLAYNYTVDWGDGTSSTHSFAAEHTYATPGIYTVEITGLFPSIYFTNSGDADKIISIDNWGDNVWSRLYGSFRGCDNLEINATDVPNLSNINSLRETFLGCTSMVGNASMNNWDVSNVTDMESVFRQASSFNSNISNWNVSNVTTMARMFLGASTFNQNINNWNTASVT